MVIALNTWSILSKEVFQEALNEYSEKCFVLHASSSKADNTKRQRTDLFGEKSLQGNTNN